MIVDTSAVVAVVVREPGHERYLEAMLAVDRPKLSAATLLELYVVIDRLGDAVISRRLEDLLTGLGVETLPLTVEQVAAGRAAYRDFGKGSGHPARLNLGDCFSYALARVSGEPLLFQGDDFVHTDVVPAVAV